MKMFVRIHLSFLKNINPTIFVFAGGKKYIYILINCEVKSHSEYLVRNPVHSAYQQRLAVQDNQCVLYNVQGVHCVLYKVSCVCCKMFVMCTVQGVQCVL